MKKSKAGQNRLRFALRTSNAPVAGSMVPASIPARRSVPRWTKVALKSNVCPRSGISRRTVHTPLMSVHGTTGELPPHTPALQVSPVVQGRPSSQALPSAAGWHTEGFPAQVQHGSTWHSASQPSPFVVLPSKQVQRAATMGPTKNCSGGTKPTLRPSRRFPLGMTRPESPAWIGGRLPWTL